MQSKPIALYSSYQPTWAHRLRHSKALVAIVAVLGVTVMALAAALVVNRSDAQPSGSGVAAAPAAKSTANISNSKADLPVANVSTTPNRANTANPANAAQTSPASTSVAKTGLAVACASCGTVQSVTQVQRQGQVNGVPVGNTTIGIGAVAGGVLGGLLGNQVGNGNGKTVATVLGAAGGAYAGNTVEKNMKKVTVYNVRVRMDDGSMRALDLSSAVPVGAKVIVEGKNLRLAAAKG